MEIEIADRTKARYAGKAVNFVWDFFHVTFKRASVKKFFFGRVMGSHYMVRLYNNYFTDEIHADIIFGVKLKSASIILCVGKEEVRRDVKF